MGGASWDLVPRFKAWRRRRWRVCIWELMQRSFSFSFSLLDFMVSTFCGRIEERERERIKVKEEIELCWREELWVQLLMDVWTPPELALLANSVFVDTNNISNHDYFILLVKGLFVFLFEEVFIKCYFNLLKWGKSRNFLSSLIKICSFFSHFASNIVFNITILPPHDPTRPVKGVRVSRFPL